METAVLDPDPYPLGLKPSGIKAPHGALVLGVSWPAWGARSSGLQHQLTHRNLRGYCPCAGCQGHSGDIRFQASEQLELRALKPVGNYALCLTWGDGHDSGIYSFEYLWRLGELERLLGPEGLEQLGLLPKVGSSQARRR